MLNPKQPFVTVGAGSRKQRPTSAACSSRKRSWLQAPAGQTAAPLCRLVCRNIVPAGDTGSVFDQLCMVVLLRPRCRVSATVPRLRSVSCVQNGLFSCAYNDVYQGIQAAMHPASSVCAGMAVLSCRSCACSLCQSNLLMQLVLVWPCRWPADPVHAWRPVPRPQEPGGHQAGGPPH